LKKDEDKRGKERERVIKDIVNTKPPSYPYNENIPYINFSEGSLALMWDKRKGKPKYDQKNDVLWLRPYIVKKEAKKGRNYLSAMDGRKMPLPVDRSLLQSYVQET
jgi:hypothetical protein